MKWYSTEIEPGVLIYNLADKMIQFAEDQELAMRGHCLFWAREKFIQPWVRQLTPDELRIHVSGRIENIVPRYKGKVTCWDVNNEMLDGSFFKNRLGPDIRPFMFKKAHELDPGAPLFVNEYSILDDDEKLNRYIELIHSLKAGGAPLGGIGVQEHGAERFSPAPDEPGDEPERKNRAPLEPGEVWRRLDQLGKFEMPIHLTEISAKTIDPERRADALETLFRVGFSHPKVEAILLWGFWAKAHWLGPSAALVDEDWNILPAGHRIGKLLLQEWRTNLDVRTDSDGLASFRGFYGSYNVTASDAGNRVLAGSVSLTAHSTNAQITLALQ